MARKLGGHLYGVWVFWGVLVSTPSVFYSGAMVAAARFIPIKQTQEEKRIVFWGLVHFQLILILAAWVGLTLANELFFQWRPWADKLIVSGVNFTWVVFLALLRHVFHLVSSAGSQCALGFQQVYLTQSMSAIKHVVDLLLVSVVAWQTNNIQDFLVISMVCLIVSQIIMGVFWVAWLHKTLGGFAQPAGAFRSVWATEIREYSGPTIFTGLMTAAKERLPIVILGELGLWAEGAVYTIISRVCQFANKFYSAISTELVSLLVGTKEGEKAQNVLSYWATLYHGVIGILLLVSAGLWLSLWNIGESPSEDLLLFVIIAMFICKGSLRSAHTWGDYSGNRIWMSKWSAAFGAVYLLSILFLHQTSVEIAICELIALIAAITVAVFMPANVWRNKRASFVTTLAFVIVIAGIYGLFL
jgi:O-antigen/teichoic acid export membrane protein